MFKYNDEGIREAKTKNGVKTTYYLDGSRIVGEETNGNLTIYIYDSFGLPIGVQYHDASYADGEWDIYWYEKNLQGDVIAIYDQSGSKVVAYKYDAWGNCTSTTTENTVLANNPFRYRSYYYDVETGFYYVSSRYYDPKIGRWINADGYVSTGQGVLGNNMFAYCGNNPVNRVDPTGQFWKELWDAFTQTIQQASGYFAVAAGVSQVDTPVPGPADVVSGVLLIGGALVCAGIATYTVITAPAPSISIPKAEEKTEAIVIPREPDSPVIFPVDPNTFNPVGLVKVPRAGTKNGAFISWMDPLTNTEVFRWDENPNYSNGPHYHIHGTGHYYPGMIVPEPYATIYFPFR